MKTLKEYKKEQLNDPDFRREYEAIQPELDILKAMIDARELRNLTQKQLAERAGMNQSDISKLENGMRNPTVALLNRLADAMDMNLKIEFIPKKKV